MNLLDFYADVRQQKGASPYGSRVTVRLETGNDMMCYYNMWKYRENYEYEYLFVSPRGSMTGDGGFYGELLKSLRSLPAKEQHGTLKKMGLMECDLGGLIRQIGVSFDGYSVIGTCNAEKKCKKESACRKISGCPCCTGRVVGFHRGVDFFPSIFTDMVIWQTICPALDVILVVHGVVSGDEKFFLFKGNKVCYISDKDTANQLYREYIRKYPCDVTYPLFN